MPCSRDSLDCAKECRRVEVERQNYAHRRSSAFLEVRSRGIRMDYRGDGRIAPEFPAGRSGAAAMSHRFRRLDRRAGAAEPGGDEVAAGAVRSVRIYSWSRRLGRPSLAGGKEATGNTGSASEAMWRAPCRAG